MNRVLIVAVREFLEVVKTRTFLVSTLLLPGLILGATFGATKLAEWSESQPQPPRHIAVIDQTQHIYELLAAQVQQFNEAHPARKIILEKAAPDATPEMLRKRVQQGELYAYIVLPPGVLDGSQPVEIGRADSQLSMGKLIEQLVQDAVVEARYQTAEPRIDRALIRRLEAPPAFRDVDVTSGQEVGGSEFARVMTPFAFMFLLFMGTFSISQGLLTTVIEEKSSRIVEVLLSAVSPTKLLAGKIIGMACVGLLLLAVWTGVGAAAAHARGMEYLVTPVRVFWCLMYFLPGFLLFSAFLGAVGSACNTLKDAQSMASPMTLLTVIPLMLWWQISDQPQSLLAVGLSFVPPLTPFVMILRICADPNTPVWQIVLSLVLLWAAVVVLIWAAGRIFRVGILMYGKPPRLAELLRWVRYA